jgi:uncharacterized protein YdhG (YjbR/CyaY superfamily)
MVQSQAPTVDAYLTQASPQRAPALQRVRALARQVLQDHEERMHWGMPSYLRDGRITFGFAETKHYLSLYFVNPAGLEKNAQALGGLDRGKGCLRFRQPAAVDWSLVEKLLIDTRDSASHRPPTGGAVGSSTTGTP